MTALDVIRITGRIALPDDVSPTNAAVEFRLTGFDTDQSTSVTVLDRPILAAINEAGDIDVSLWPTQRGVRTRYYKVKVLIRDVDRNDKVDLGQISVASSGGPYNINDLLPVSPPSGVGVDEYIAQLAADVVAANSSVALANAAADRAEAASALKFDSMAQFIAFDDSEYAGGALADTPAGQQIKVTGATAGAAGSVKDGWLPFSNLRLSELLDAPRDDSSFIEGEALNTTDGFSLVKSPAAATDPHLTIAGGAKFYEFTGQPGLGVSRWLTSANTVLAIGDSLTAGANGTSYLDFLKPSLFNARGYGGNGFSSSRAQRSGIESLSSSDPEYPYAPTFDGVRNTDWQSGDFVVWDTDDADWDTARVWYLRQPGGGQFAIEHGAGSIGNTGAIDTSHTEYELAYYDFAKVTGGNGRVKCEWITGGDGNMCIFGAQLISDGGTGVVHNIAKGGFRAEQFADMNTVQMTAFYASLNPDLAIVNLGRNDIGNDATAADTLGYVQSVVSRIPATCDILIVGFNAAIDDGSTEADAYKDLLRAWAIDNGYGYVSDLEFLGRYARAVARGFMGASPDGVHPSSEGNAVRAMEYCRRIGLPFQPTFALPAFDNGTSGGAGPTYEGNLTTADEVDVTASGSATFFTLGLINGNPQCLLELEIWANRTGTSGWRKTVHYIRVANSTASGEVNGVGTPQEIINQSEAPNSGTAPDWTLSAAINGDDHLEISVTETAGYNTRFSAKCSYRFLRLTQSGVSVFQY